MQDILKFANKTYNLTEDQKEALRNLNLFFQSDSKCFILKGYAGTGKTFLIKCISYFLKQENVNTVLLAPTGRASRILSEKTKQISSTIHKGIYNLDEIDEEKTSKNGKEKFKFKFNLKHTESNTKNIYIIDESSMISDKYSEGDFFIFGSGRLLNDLISYISLTNEGRKDRIIFIGDSAQLPPVTDNISGALDKHYLLEKHTIKSYEFELTEVVRQHEDSGILHNATYLRNQLLNKKRNSFELKAKFPDVIKLEIDEVVNTYLKENETLSLNKTIIINYSNKSALEFNLGVREKIFNDKMKVEVNDILIINQNNYNYKTELLNGTLIKIVDISPIPEIKSGMKSYNEKGEDCKVTHKFRRIRISVPTEKGNIEVSCLILENFLYSPNPSLDYSENIALYLDFKIRNNHLNPKTKEFADALRADPYFNVLRVKYGYSITCHKAQGGEWSSAIINLDVNQGKLSDNFLRWTYTAITRASKKLYLFNIPNENQFSKLKYNHQLIDKVKEKEVEVIHFTIPNNFNKLLGRFNLKDDDEFKIDKFKTLLAISSSEKIEIINRLSHNYREIYVFKQNEKKAGIIFNYNGNEKFTKINVAKNHTTDSDFATSLIKKFNQKINIYLSDKSDPISQEGSLKEQDDNLDLFFPEKYSSYRILYNELSEQFRKEKIEIENVLHKEYQELYTLKRKEETATIQFYYDGLDRFTEAQPLLNKCNSNELLISVNKSINNLIKN